MRANIFLDTRYGFRRDIIPVIVVGSSVGDFPDQHTISGVIEVYLCFAPVIVFFHLDDVDGLHTLAFEHIHVVDTPRCGGVLGSGKCRTDGFGKHGERYIRLGHIPLSTVVEPCRKVAAALLCGDAGAVKREISHHIATFGLPADVRGRGVFGQQGRLGLRTNLGNGQRIGIARAALIAARKRNNTHEQGHNPETCFHTKLFVIIKKSLSIPIMQSDYTEKGQKRRRASKSIRQPQ